MKELVEKVAALYADFSKDANAQLENGNKAAGTRARKASLEIEKAMKEFRKASLEASFLAPPVVRCAPARQACWGILWVAGASVIVLPRTAVASPCSK